MNNAVKKDTSSLNSFARAIFGDALDDDTITEIAINDYDGIWIEDKEGWFFDNRRKLDPEMVKNFIVALASYCNDKIDDTKPILSAVMPNLERVQVVIAPTTKHISITIRKPSTTHITFDNYINSGFFSKIQKSKSSLSDIDLDLCRFFSDEKYVDFIRLAVVSHKNIVICGGTGSGKTTFMKSLIDLMDENERIITIEDVPEIQFFKHKNYVNLFYPSESKTGDIITSSSLLKSCLRMKPDRILLAELRGAETFDYLNVIMSGHDGGITSCHSSDVNDTFKRLLAMASQHETASTLGIEFLKTLLDSIHVIINIDRDYDRSRKINEIYFDKYSSYLSLNEKE